MRDKMTFFVSFYEAIKEETNAAKRAKAYDALFEYAFYGAEPTDLKGVGKAAFVIAKPFIDKGFQDSENGKRGGAAKGNQNARKYKEDEEKTTPLVFEKQPPSFEQNKRGTETKTSNINMNMNKNMNIEKECIKEKEDHPPDFINEYIKLYPKKTNNLLGTSEAFTRELMQNPKLEPTDIIQAVKNYAEAVKILKTEERFIKNPDRFLKDGTYLDYLQTAYKPPSSPKSKTNAFMQGEQREYDFDALERALVNK